MKKIILLAAFFTAGLMFTETKAQVKVNISFNIGSQPVWGPVGYDYVQYYYMPDIDVYYYVPTQRYVYLDRGRWIFSPYMPVRYRNYDLFSTYKVVINEPRAYLHHNVHVVNYQKYKGNNNKQVIIRNSTETKYVVVNNKYKQDNEKREREQMEKNKNKDKKPNEKSKDKHNKK